MLRRLFAPSSGEVVGDLLLTGVLDGVLSFGRGRVLGEVVLGEDALRVRRCGCGVGEVVVEVHILLARHLVYPAMTEQCWSGYAQEV